MTTKKPPETTPIAVAMLPRIPSQLAARADGIATAVDEDTEYFPTKTAEATQTHTDVATFRVAIQAAQRRDPGAIAARDLEAAAVRYDVQRLVSLVQGIANKLPHDAAVQLITSKLLSVSQAGKRGPKSTLTVKQGPVSGSVKVSILSVGRPATYFVEVSADQKEWTSQPPVQRTTLTITGLTPGQTYYFRFHALVKSIPRDCCPAVPFLVM